MANMEVFYRPSPELTIKVEARGVEEMFQAIGPLQEVLGGNCKCGKCGGEKIRMVHRKTPDGHDVYELMCVTPNSNGIPCGAKLSLGKSSEGNLFPRRYEQAKGADGKWSPKLDADGKKVWLPNKGWVKWDAKANDGKGGNV